MIFFPDPEIGGPVDQWWRLSPALVVRILGILGFEDAEVTYSTHQYMHGKIDLFTVVAERTIEQDPLDLLVA